MNRGISKARTHRSRVNLSKTLQETLLAAITDSSAGMSYLQLPRVWTVRSCANSSRIELVPNPRDQPPVDGDISPDAPLQSTKRPFNVTSDIDSLPTKRARLTQTDIQQPRVKEKTVKQADKVWPSLPMLSLQTNKDPIQPILQQPEPNLLHLSCYEKLPSTCPFSYSDSSIDHH